MTPTRSAHTRSKRDSTKQSVDFFNDVMNPRSPAADKPGLRSTRSSQRFAKNISEKAPRSDDIWEIPRSPEQRGHSAREVASVPSAKVLTPRRSPRFQKDQPQTQGSPLRRSSRLQRGGVIEMGDLPRERRPEPRSENQVSETRSGEDTGSRSGEVEEDESVRVYLFPDEAPNDEPLELPSPTRIFQLEEWSTLALPENYNSIAPPDGDISSERSSRSSPEELAASQAVSVPDGSPSSHAGRSPPMVYIGTPKDVNSPEREIPATPSSSIDQDPEPDNDDMDEGVNMDADGAMDLDESDEAEDEPNDTSGSVYETVAEISSADSPLFVSQKSPPARVSRGKRRRSEVQTNQRRQSSYSPSSSHSSTPGSHPSQPQRSPSIGSNIGDLDQGREKPNSLLLTREAFSLGQQTENWKELTSEAHTLGLTTNARLASGFHNITSSIHHLRRQYLELSEGLKTFQVPSVEDVECCKNLLEIIKLEGNEILDHVYHEATRRKQAGRSPKLLAEFEARVIPEMVKLIIACLEAYYADPQRFTEAYDLLQDTMDLLSRFCQRMKSLTVEKIVPSNTRTFGIRTALKKLFEAAKSQRLRKGDLEPPCRGIRSPSRDIRSPSVEEIGSFAQETAEPWTDDEGAALLTGLRDYQDADRYIWIKRASGSKLSRRTIRELRLKAQEFHDKLVPISREKLRTSEGREELHWLTSIR